MLRISKYKERIYLNNDPIVHYLDLLWATEHINDI